MTLTRRRLLGTSAAIGLAGSAALLHRPTTLAQTPAATPVPPALDALAIDLPVEPPTLDPALVYDSDGWSVIHSIYDSLVIYGPDGTLRPLLAESWDLSDPAAITFRLRGGITFHDGQPLTSHDVAATFRHLLDPATASQAAGNFTAISGIDEIDPLTVRLGLSAAAPYLLSQIAAYGAILPASVLEQGSDLSANPVGTGPYRFTGWQRGQQLTLTANPAYSGATKGWPLARTATFRFVPDATTEVADLRSGTAQIIRSVSIDQAADVDASGIAKVVVAPLSGLTFVRIASDTPPFDNPRVRQALNYAVDVNSILAALVRGEASGIGGRLATLLDPTSIGYDPALAPYPYDLDRARALLKMAGVRDGLKVAMEIAGSDGQSIAEAIAGQLGDAGLDVSVNVVENAAFNATWQDPSAAPLRLVTWTPLFDPYSLLGLVVASDGGLSRYHNDQADALIAAGATTPDPTARAAAYQQLGGVLHDDPPAIFLYGLVARPGVATSIPTWTPRPDGYLLPVAGGDSPTATVVRTHR